MDQTAQVLAGAVGTLFLALQAAWGVYTVELRRSRDDCCRQRDEYRKANEESLSAYRRREEEERAWQRQHERDGRRGAAG